MFALYYVLGRYSLTTVPGVGYVGGLGLCADWRVVCTNIAGICVGIRIRGWLRLYAKVDYTTEAND